MLKNFVHSLFGLTLLWLMPIVDLALPKYRFFLDIAYLIAGVIYALIFIVFGMMSVDWNSKEPEKNVTPQANPQVDPQINSAPQQPEMDGHPFVPVKTERDLFLDELGKKMVLLIDDMRR
jgi:hypothetical protein